MPDQYLRRASLVVASDTDALDLSELQIRFTIRQWDLQTPNSLVARLYNVAEATALRIQKEFTRVVLQAGYQNGAFGVVFDGTVVQVRRGRENATDTYLDIVAADGDEAYCFAIVSTSLAAGSTAKDRLAAITKAMGDHGVTAGYTPDLPSAALPRGKVMFGMARDHLRTQADNAGARWSIQNSAVQVLPITGALPDQAVVLTSNTGMIGLPEQTQDGIAVRCLLNPNLKPGGKVQIDNKSIQRAQLAVDVSGGAQNAFLPRVSDDGFYRALVVQHSGDTRGNDWYSDLVCIALDDGATPGLVARGYG